MKQVEDELAEALNYKKISSSIIKGEKLLWLERKPINNFAANAILIGGFIQIVPTIMVKSNICKCKTIYPLELEGIYIYEGCVGCHSMVDLSWEVWTTI
jgi:cytochrome c oxidase cbb3-type subunit I/II